MQKNTVKLICIFRQKPQKLPEQENLPKNLQMDWLFFAF